MTLQAMKEIRKEELLIIKIIGLRELVDNSRKIRVLERVNRFLKVWLA